MQGLGLFALCLVLPVSLSGCGMTVTPPPASADQVTVFIADHGIHTSLVLPRSDGTLAEFTYSRYDWAALDQDQWYRSLPALLIPGPGTIGTRSFPGPDTRENVAHQFELANSHPPVQALFAVPVSAATCEQVLSSLDSRWHDHEDTAVTNQKRGLRFVKDPANYSLFHNCNHELAGWLRLLGCRVSGATMTADVTVRPSPPP